MSVLDVDRRRALAFRLRAHGLAGEPPSAALLDLGVQDTSTGSARLAFAARRSSDDGCVTVWSHRGAPHRHRSADVPALAVALWPDSDPDAAARLGWQRGRVAEAGMPAREAIATVAAAMQRAVTGAMVKGSASAAVSALVPPGLVEWCRGCGSRHLHDQLFRLGGLPAGILLDTSQVPLLMAPSPGWPGVPSAREGTGAVVTAYLRLHGPATASEAAGFLGTTRTALQPSWPSELTEVRLEGRRAWVHPSDVDALRSAEPVTGVRLLPPADPYLQARDRALLVPEVAHQKALWRILGNPGAVLVDGEIAGLWRAKKAGRSRSLITVEPFVPLSPRTRAMIEDETALVGEVRGTQDVTVAFGS